MSEQRYPVHVAENFLRWNLPANSKDIEARAQAVGIASTTLWRARRRLGVVVKDAVWRLPGESAPEVSALPRPEPPAPHDPRLCAHCGLPGTADDPVRQRTLAG